MNSKLLMIATCLLTCAQVQADGLDLLRAGTAAQQSGDSRKAISMYTSALDGGALTTEAKAVAHNNRAAAYTVLGDIKHAIEDYDQAIAMKTGYAEAYNNRGTLYLHIGKVDRAISDLSQALANKAKFATAFANRGHARFMLGQYAASLDDYDHALQLNASDKAHILVRQYVARVLTGVDGQAKLKAAMQSMSGDAWPVLAMRMFAGEATPDAVIASANSGAEDGRSQRLSEALFYSGVYHLVHGDPGRGRKLLTQASNGGKVAMIDAMSAAFALQHMPERRMTLVAQAESVPEVDRKADASDTRVQASVESPAPVVTVAAAPTQRRAEAPNRSSEPVPTSETGTSFTGIALHLISMRTPEAARKGWSELLARYPDLLRGAKFSVLPVDVPQRGLMYRVLAGPVAQESAAETLCARFKTRRQYCKVMVL